jgi:hypothetical protein
MTHPNILAACKLLMQQPNPSPFVVQTILAANGAIGDDDEQHVALSRWRRVDGPPVRIGDLGTDATPKTFDMTQKYIRTAEAIGTAIGDLFPALPASLLERQSGNRLGNRQAPMQVFESTVPKGGLEPPTARL